MNFLSGPKTTRCGLASRAASGRAILLQQGAQLPWIAMECDGAAFLCCGCEPAPALVYVAWYINLATRLPAHGQLILDTGKRSFGFIASAWVRESFSAACCLWRDSSATRLGQADSQQGPGRLQKPFLKTIISRMNAASIKEDRGTRFFWRDTMLHLLHGIWIPCLQAD